MSQQHHEPSAQNWVVLIFLSLVWGSSFILMKKGLVSFTGVQVGSLRISIAFLLFLPYAIRVIKRIPRDRLKYILGVGLAGSFVPAFLFATAQTKIDSAPAGILNSLTPLTTYLWGLLIFGQQNSKHRLLGILIGLIGAIVLVIEPNNKLGFNAYALLILLATICYGLSGNIAKTYLNEVRSRDITALSFALVGIPALLILASTNFIEVMQTDANAWKSLGYVAILSVVGTALALMLFWKLIQDTDAIFGSLTTYLIPIVAIIWGLIDGETIFAHQYIGFALILISVFLVKRKVPIT